MPAPSTAPAAIPGTAAIRCGVAFIGAIAFALSYDALVRHEAPPFPSRGERPLPPFCRSRPG